MIFAPVAVARSTRIATDKDSDFFSIINVLKGGTDETVCPSFFVHSPRKPFNTIGYDSWRSKRD